MSEELIGGYIHPEISHEEALRLQQKLADWDWEKFRREAAKDILCALLMSGYQDLWSNTVREALKATDILIEQLKDGK